MKIGGTKATAPAANVKKTDKVARAEKTGAAPVIDETLLAGIPEAELTPRVRETLVTLISEVQELRAELAATRGRLREMESLADSDALVNMFNRRAFVRELERVLAMVDRYKIKACLVFIDLNELKQINDQRGHAAGDAALKHVADVITGNIRQTDVAGRLGGDEFAVILTHLDEETARAKAVSLTDLVAAEDVVAGAQRFRVGISHGLVPIAQGVSADQTMEKADSAMYEAKRSR